jgi:2-polyprenyl-3-methyl-5-hydroxy-6-metoxy-1,4-benzoquinol methylase
MFLDDISGGKILDVGCGDGRFLSRMHARGWTVDGIDFDAQAIATVKQKYGLHLRHGNLLKAGLEANSFDAVTMSHVVEHLPDPIAFVNEIHRILKPGGRFVATTPNADGLGHKKFGQHWWGLDAPRHLHVFSAASLAEVGRRGGFTNVKISSTSANADVFIGASYTVQENPNHRMGHSPTPSVLRTLKAAAWQFREHSRLSSDPNCGEELVLTCVKA